MKILLLSLIAGLCLISCSPSENAEIIHAKLGEYDLYIPKAYLKFGHTSIGPDAALIQAWYPGADIPPGDNGAELLKKGVWWKNVRILISKTGADGPNTQSIKKSLEHMHATKIVGEEFGLIHKTQPDGQVQDHYDVWLEMDGEKIISYITCSDETEGKWFPQCKQYMWAEPRIQLKISYSRRLLPEWKKIKTNVEAMMESFESEDASKEFIKLRMQDLENNLKESGE